LLVDRDRLDNRSQLNPPGQHGEQGDKRGISLHRSRSLASSLPIDECARLG